MDRLEVQLLFADGRAKSTIHFLDGERTVKVDDDVIPAAVLEAAERTRQIGGQYVDSKGQLLDFYGRPRQDLTT